MAGVAVDTERWLYARMEANLLASWSADAAGSTGARVAHLPGADAAIFPTPPEGIYLNNALLARGLEPSSAGLAIAAVEDAYLMAGIGEYAVWSHDSEHATMAELERRGYHVDTCTRAMAMSLDDARPRPAATQVAVGDWGAYQRLLPQLGAPDGLLAGVGDGTYDVLIGKLDGTAVAAALAYDHDGDCGIYNVGTVPHARRRGIATDLTALAVQRARERGCTTASLQSTPMAERVYAAVGFRDLGRFVEYVR
jgi:ribosomal protein S18 acetylase RimI-like enzyme